MTEAVYILEPGSYIRRESESLKVMKGQQVLEHIPANDLRKMTLVGHISLSSGVLDFLIRKRVETVFITPTGRFRARLLPDEHRHVALRKAQYLRLNDAPFALDAAIALVQCKMTNMQRFLLQRAGIYDSTDLKTAAIKIKAVRRHLKTASDGQVVRGMEGAGSRIYFGAFQHLLRNPAFTFNGRNRRPPRDPVNALLSFVYTLLTNEVLSAIQACGLDPYMGALHTISYGRPSLACDLVEEYRSFLGDRFVLGLLNKRMIKPEDFIRRTNSPAAFTDEAEMRAKRPVEMKPALMRTLIAAYEEMMNRSIRYPPLDKKLSHRWLIMNQVRQFGAYLEKDENYQPFLWQV